MGRKERPKVHGQPEYVPENREGAEGQNPNEIGPQICFAPSLTTANCEQKVERAEKEDREGELAFVE